MRSLDERKDEEIGSWVKIGSDKKTLEEYKRNAAEGKNYTYFDEKQYFQHLVKEHGEAASAAFPMIEICTTTKERPSKKKSSELISLEALVKIAKEQQQQQKQQIIAPKPSRRRKKSL